MAELTTDERLALIEQAYDDCRRANAECDGIVYRVGPDDRGAETACQASLDIMLETHTRDYQELVDGIKWDYERYRYDWEPDWSDDMAPEYVPLEYERIA